MVDSPAKTEADLDVPKRNLTGAAKTRKYGETEMINAASLRVAAIIGALPKEWMRNQASKHMQSIVSAAATSFQTFNDQNPGQEISPEMLKSGGDQINTVVAQEVAEELPKDAQRAKWESLIAAASVAAASRKKGDFREILQKMLAGSFAVGLDAAASDDARASADSGSTVSSGTTPRSASASNTDSGGYERSASFSAPPPSERYKSSAYDEADRRERWESSELYYPPASSRTTDDDGKITNPTEGAIANYIAPRNSMQAKATSPRVTGTDGKITNATPGAIANYVTLPKATNPLQPKAATPDASPQVTGEDGKVTNPTPGATANYVKPGSYNTLKFLDEQAKAEAEKKDPPTAEAKDKDEAKKDDAPAADAPRGHGYDMLRARSKAGASKLEALRDKDKKEEAPAVTAVKATTETPAATPPKDAPTPPANTMLHQRAKHHAPIPMA